MVASMKSSVPDMTRSKMTSCQIILTPTYGLVHTEYKSPPLLRAAQIEGSITGKRAITYELVNETIITKANLQNSYYRNTNVILRSSLKSTPSSCKTESLYALSYMGNVTKQPKLKLLLETIMQKTTMKEGF